MSLTDGLGHFEILEVFWGGISNIERRIQWLLTILHAKTVYLTKIFNDVLINIYYSFNLFFIKT